MKTQRFHDKVGISWKSWDFMKTSRFHEKSKDFMEKSNFVFGFLQNNIKCLAYVGVHFFIILRLFWRYVISSRGKALRVIPCGKHGWRFTAGLKLSQITISIKEFIKNISRFQTEKYQRLELGPWEANPRVEPWDTTLGIASRSRRVTNVQKIFMKRLKAPTGINRYENV